jgi:hypothetical protein
MKICADKSEQVIKNYENSLTIYKIPCYFKVFQVGIHPDNYTLLFIKFI